MRGASVTILALFSFSPFVVAANETALFLSPQTATYDTNTVFEVRVLVSTGGEKVNAIEGKLSFDPKELEVDRIERATSILSSWTLEPRYDNTLGEIVFAGLTSTSSFSGDRGEVLTLFVRGLRSTETRLRFESGSAVLAGDGTGANILATMNSGLYAFVPKENSPASSPEGELLQSGEVLGVETVRLASPTHPDENSWYSKTSADFVWQNPAETEQVLLSLTRSPLYQGGGRTFFPPIEKRTVTEVDEGVSYFYVTKVNGDGSSERESMKIQVDTQRPNVFELEETSRSPDDPKVRFSVTATDTLSGIEKVEFSLDDNPPATWKDIDSRAYEFTVGSPGKHVIRAVAYDRAGNTTEKTLEFTVDPLPPPVLNVAKEQEEGNPLSVTGSSIPGATITLTLTSASLPAPQTESLEVGPDGEVSFLGSQELFPGAYQLVALVSDARGAQSLTTPPVEFMVDPTILGMLKRHPFIPVASGILIVLLVVSVVIVRRLRRAGSDVVASKIDTPHAAVVRPSFGTAIVAPAAQHLIHSQHVPEPVASAPHHAPKIEKGVIDLR